MLYRLHFFEFVGIFVGISSKLIAIMHNLIAHKYVVSIQFGLMRTLGSRGSSRKRRCSVCRQSSARQCK
jgi:hypothetical protein